MEVSRHRSLGTLTGYVRDAEFLPQLMAAVARSTGGCAGLGCVLLAAKLAEPLRDQAFLGQKAHERDRESGFVAVRQIEILFGHVHDELLRVRDLADRDLAVCILDDLLDLHREYVWVLLLVVLDRLQEHRRLPVHEHRRPLGQD
jgi:hypothetical protein